MIHSCYNDRPVILRVRIIFIASVNSFPVRLGAFVCSAFSRPKSAKLLKTSTKRRNSKKQLSLSVAICNRKHANRILRPKVGVSLVVQANIDVTAKRLDYYVGITNLEPSVGSIVERGQLWSNQSPSWTQLRFPTATVCSRPKSFQKFRSRAREYTCYVVHPVFSQ